MVEVLGVLVAGQRIGAVGTELRGALKRERANARQAKPQDRRQGVSGISLPDAGAGRRRNEGRLAVHGVRVSTVVRAQRGHRCGHLLTDVDPVRLRWPVRDSGEVAGVVSVENRLLGWCQAECGLQADQRVVGRGCDGGCG